MHRIDSFGATVDNKFTDGNPSTSTPATRVDAAIMNAFQEEIVSVVLAAGITLVKGTNTQLLAALPILTRATVLTGFSATTGTVANTDTVLQAINKLAGNQALYLPLAGGTVTGTIVSSNTTESTSTITGAIRTAGGLGVVKNAWIGGTLSVAGVASITDTTQATSTITGALKTSGGLGVALNAWIGGTLNVAGVASVTDTTAASSTTTGSLKTAGGLGVAGAAYIGGILNVAGAQTFTGATTHAAVVSVTDATEASSTTVASLKTAGGLAVVKRSYFGGWIYILDTTNSTSTSTGAITTLGGIGVALQATIGGITTVTNTTEATSTGTGAIVTSGGLGVAKRAHFGARVLIGAPTDDANYMLNIAGAIKVSAAGAGDGLTGHASGTYIWGIGRQNNGLSLASLEAIYFYPAATNASTPGTLMGFVASTGKWTVGASGGTQTHDVNGGIALKGPLTTVGYTAGTSGAGTFSQRSAQINNGSSLAIMPSANAYGILVARRADNGHAALYMLAGNISNTLISNPNSTWSTTNGGSTNNVWVNASNYIIQNGGATTTYDYSFWGYTGTSIV